MLMCAPPRYLRRHSSGKCIEMRDPAAETRRLSMRVCYHVCMVGDCRYALLISFLFAVITHRERYLYA